MLDTVLMVCYIETTMKNQIVLSAIAVTIITFALVSSAPAENEPSDQDIIKAKTLASDIVNKQKNIKEINLSKFTPEVQKLIYEYSGDLLVENKKYEAAVDAYLLAQNKTKAVAVAEGRAKEDNLNLAYTLFEKIDSPGVELSHIGFSELAITKKRTDLAEKILLKIKKENPSPAINTAIFNLAREYDRLGLIDKAIRLLDEVKASTDFYLELGRAHFKADPQRLSQAETYFTYVAAPAECELVAKEYFKKGSVIQALKVYECLVKEEKTKKKINEQIAAGNLEEAVKALRDADVKIPDENFILAGEILLKNALLKEARRYNLMGINCAAGRALIEKIGDKELSNKNTDQAIEDYKLANGETARKKLQEIARKFVELKQNKKAASIYRFLGDEGTAEMLESE